MIVMEPRGSREFFRPPKDERINSTYNLGYQIDCCLHSCIHIPITKLRTYVRVISSAQSSASGQPCMHIAVVLHRIYASKMKILK